MLITKLTKEMKLAVKRSGYLMEQKVASLLKKQGYYTIPNYSFKDQETGISRELDIWAMGAYMISKREFEFLYPILLLECKNIDVPLIFFSQEEARTHYVLGEVIFSGIPIEIKTKQGYTEDISEYLNLEKYHHYYFKGKISSQFCALLRKNGKWIASHSLDGPAGNLYDSMILPLVKALGAEKKEHDDSFVPDPKNELINLQVYYPIIIVKDNLFECLVNRRIPTYRKVNRINFIRRYESEKIKGEYRIDVVTEKGLKDLLKLIEFEVKKMATRIKSKKRFLRMNARRIARQKVKEDK